MDWKPIDTAPKDGTEILIAGGTFHYDAATFRDDTEFSGVTIAYWRRDGWCGGYGAEYDGEYWHKPTHWMPLPKPPTPHASDCATHNEPALPKGHCDCGA